jgi:hypothetical protein
VEKGITKVVGGYGGGRDEWDFLMDFNLKDVFFSELKTV